MGAARGVRGERGAQSRRCSGKKAGARPTGGRGATSTRDVYQGLDPATYPSLTAVRPELPAMADSSFAQAVDLLLEALAARASAREQR
ncbi:hypothetical protein ACFV20_10925 [Streptomyces sp. NPDC059696]|uniref:hypothetical protein n=1 Tax=Streptomyces sp. NPDC059696 TaxID=3346911 RepID=UPI0036AEAD8F